MPLFYISYILIKKILKILYWGRNLQGRTGKGPKPLGAEPEKGRNLWQPYWLPLSFCRPGRGGGQGQDHCRLCCWGWGVNVYFHKDNNFYICVDAAAAQRHIPWFICRSKQLFPLLYSQMLFYVICNYVCLLHRPVCYYFGMTFQSCVAKDHWWAYSSCQFARHLRITPRRNTIITREQPPSPRDLHKEFSSPSPAVIKFTRNS